ncbi:unnamed protein product [Acanthosepion pharaonis]|uniref:Major facilitator superfamily associated domain-containing protein n=1 Tax=Acanthosepion pharaonis TaxID=158019 RepID=A0A812ALC1_ACAPH|nr:unnamed protein product [Sepia pharaonis]
MPFISFFVQPIFSFVADRFHKHKFILLFCTFMCGVSYLCLLLVPAKHIPHTISIKTNVHCNTQDSYIRDCLPFQTNQSGASRIVLNRVDHCPLTFYEYALMSRQNNMTGIHCKASCLFAVPGAYTSRVCFTTDILKKIGHIPCLYLALAAYSIRFLCYSFLTKSWFVLAIEPLHGLTFGLMYASATGHANILAPAGLSATMQGIVGGIHFGFVPPRYNSIPHRYKSLPPRYKSVSFRLQISYSVLQVTSSALQVTSSLLCHFLLVTSQILAVTSHFLPVTTQFLSVTIQFLPVTSQFLHVTSQFPPRYKSLPPCYKSLPPPYKSPPSLQASSSPLQVSF